MILSRPFHVILGGLDMLFLSIVLLASVINAQTSVISSVTSVVGSGATITRDTSSSSSSTVISGRIVSVAGGADQIQNRRTLNGLPCIAISSRNNPVAISGGGNLIPVANDNWIPIGASGKRTRKLPDGTVVADCFDLAAGLRAHNEEYIRRNSFKYRCNNGTAELIACIGTRRSDFGQIPLGKTLEVNGFWHKCEYFKENETVKYSQEQSCFANGKELHIGDTFRSGAFKMKCERLKYSITGCYYYENGERKELALGESATVDHFKHNCEADSNVAGRVKYYVQAVGCTKNGKYYKEGDKWTRNHLRYECRQNGVADIIGCLLDNGKELSVGEDLVKNNTAYRCYRQGSLIYYHEFACDYPGTPSCKLQPVQSISKSSTTSSPITTPINVFARNADPKPIRIGTGEVVRITSVSE